MSVPCPLELYVRCVPVLNFAMEQNDVPLVRGIGVTNSTAQVFPASRLRLTTSPVVSMPLEIHLPALEPGQTLDLDSSAVNPQILRDPLVRLEERERGEIHVVITNEAGEEQQHEVCTLDLLAYNEWMGVGQLREILAAFIMPNHPAVAAMVPVIVEQLRKETGRSALSGYQSDSAEQVAQQAAAVYQALAAQGFSYASAPASFEQTGQKIRTPDQIKANGVATCLDLAVLLAALLEHIGLAPFLFLKEGHAWVGVWLTDDSFDEAVIPSAAAVKKRCALGEALVFEATGTTLSPPLPFKEACARGNDHLGQAAAFHYALDVRMARRAGIRPMPARLQGDVTVVDSALPTRTEHQTTAVAPTVQEPAPESGGSGPAVAGVDGVSRLERWKGKLLDLSRRNRLLNFRESRKTILLVCPNLASVEDALAAGDEFTVLPIPGQLQNDPRDASLHQERTGDDLVETFLLEQMEQKRLHSLHPPAELDRRMREVDREARLSLEESGASTLFLALGFLRWSENDTDTAGNLAPIVLLPMSIDRRSVRRGFRVAMVDEEARINVTLLRKLETDFDITINGLDPLPTDESGLDMPLILRRVREAIKHKDNWDVTEEAALAIFTFTKFIMWADLEVNTEALKENPIVRHLIDTPTEPFPAEPLAPVALDAIHPGELLIPLDADSSQLQAIVAAGNGASFVLQGPPGTGKSQTITNMIAYCMALGKRVLFVSEKMAALNVVKSRLEAVGLGPLCLELHSHKSTKHDFRRQLGEALDLGRFGEPELWQRRTNQLAAHREKLNDYVRAMYTPRGFGESVLWACERWSEHQDLPELLLEFGDWERVQPEDLDELLATARRLRDDAKHCGLGPDHPLLEVSVLEWRPDLAMLLRTATAELEKCADELAEQAGKALKPLRLGSANWCRFMLEFGRELIGLLVEAPAVCADLLRAPEWDEEAFARLLAVGRHRDELREQLQATYGEAYDGLPVQMLQERLRRHRESGFPMGWWNGFVATRTCRKAMVVPKARSFEELDADLANILELRACQKTLGESSLVALFGSHWRDGNPDWGQLAAQVAWGGRFRAVIRTPEFADPVEEMEARGLWIQLVAENRESILPDGAMGKVYVRYLEAFAAFQQARERMDELLEPDPDCPWHDLAAADHLGTLSRMARRWCDATPELRAWCAWQKARARALSLRLSSIVGALEAGELPPDQVPVTVEKAFAGWVLQQALAKEEPLRGFQGIELDHVVDEFRQTDEEVRELARKTLFARLIARLPEASDDDDRLRSSEMGKLKRFVKGSRRSIRQTFRECPNALSRLKPCVLMSPLSVAQFLGAEFPRFDLVVFDEASQMPPWEAIGAIARGDSLIVVGDSKQLPPTSFFERTSDEDAPLSEENLEDMESILDECVACQMPSRTLTWHYRSRHESLIAFSNYHYYANALNTFPSPDRDTTRLGVSWRPIPDGFYDAGASRTNREEAKAIVAEIVKRLSSPVQSASSIGVVTFSMSQQRLIEDLLEKARAEHPEIEPFFSNRVPEPVFVKNLETVQGDERDVILFSICYGPNREGKVAMNFGPLNNKGGERRLNVAVTRARRQLIVFSTLRPEQIDLNRTQAEGVKHLQSFLKLAAAGMGGMLDGTVQEDQALAPVAAAIADALTGKGWSVDREIGSSGCRVSLGVRHPDHRESFLLGVDVEGRFYGEAQTARDRDRLRHAVLKSLGWRLEHVWILDWCFDHERELARIERALAQALEDFVPPDERDAHDRNIPMTGEPEESADAPPPHTRLQADLVPIDDEAEAMESAGSFYRAAALAPAEGGSEAFHAKAADCEIVQRIRRVIEEEAPIAPEYIARRVAACWGVNRLTRKVVDRVFDLVPMEQVKVSDSNGRQFVWWHRQDPDAYENYRVPHPDDKDPRGAEHICPQEVANAMSVSLRRHLSLGDEDLVRAAAATFGFSRVGPVVRLAMEAGLDHLVDTDQATVADGVVSLAG